MDDPFVSGAPEATKGSVRWTDAQRTSCISSILLFCSTGIIYSGGEITMMLSARSTCLPAFRFSPFRPVVGRKIGETRRLLGYVRFSPFAAPTCCRLV